MWLLRISGCRAELVGGGVGGDGGGGEVGDDVEILLSRRVLRISSWTRDSMDEPVGGRVGDVRQESGGLRILRTSCANCSGDGEARVGGEEGTEKCGG